MNKIENDPRLRGSLLDVIPLQLNGFQPLDIRNSNTNRPWTSIFFTTTDRKELGIESPF